MFSFSYFSIFNSWNPAQVSCSISLPDGQTSVGLYKWMILPYGMILRQRIFEVWVALEKLRRCEISVITPQNGSFNPTGTACLFLAPWLLLPAHCHHPTPVIMAVTPSPLINHYRTAKPFTPMKSKQLSGTQARHHVSILQKPSLGRLTEHSLHSWGAPRMFDIPTPGTSSLCSFCNSGGQTGAVNY